MYELHFYDGDDRHHVVTCDDNPPQLTYGELRAGPQGETVAEIHHGDPKDNRWHVKGVGSFSDVVIAHVEPEQDPSTALHRTRYVVTVLSEGPIPPGLDISEVLHEADVGDYVASVKDETPEAISGREMAAELTAAGSEPGFFQLDANGDKAGS